MTVKLDYQIPCARVFLYTVPFVLFLFFGVVGPENMLSVKEISWQLLCSRNVIDLYADRTRTSGVRFFSRDGLPRHIASVHVLASVSHLQVEGSWTRMIGYIDLRAVH